MEHKDQRQIVWAKLKERGAGADVKYKISPITLTHNILLSINNHTKTTSTIVAITHGLLGITHNI